MFIKSYMKTNSQIKLLRIILVVTIGIILTSCFKTDPDSISDKVTWSPNFSIPLGATVFSIPQEEADIIDVGDFYTPPPEYWYDTLEFNISGVIEYRESIKSLMFRINMTNEFPAQSEIFVFYPEDDQGVDYSRSLTGSDPIEIAEGKIDDQGKVSIPSKKRVDIEMTPSQIDDLMTSNRLIIRTVVRNMYITDEVKSNLTQYRFISQLGIQAQIVKVYE